MMGFPLGLGNLIFRERRTLKSIGEKLRVPDYYLNSIIYLFRSREDAELMRDPGGSGFIVTAPAKPWKRPTTKPESPEDRYKLGYEHARQREEDMRARYFVTNAHVIAAGNHFVRVNVFQGQQPIVKEITEWAYHPDADLVIGFFEYAAGQGTVGYHPIGANSLIVEYLG